MVIKVLIGCYLILIATAWFNKKIVETQDQDDNQSWHIAQLIQWITFYGVIAYFTDFWIVLGFGFTYPFFYDGILNLFMKREWFYGGVKGFGYDYTIAKKIKIIMLLIGVVIWTLFSLKFCSV